MPSVPARRLAAVWALLILALLSVPGPALPEIPHLLGLDKLVHFALFAVLGWLLMHALSGSAARRTAWTLGLGLSYAVGSEIYQYLLPFGRTFDPYDALADAIGLCAALILALVLHRRTFIHTGDPVR